MAAPYSIPDMNVMMQFWDQPYMVPPGSAPLFNGKGNLAFGRRVSPTGVLTEGCMYALVPAGSDVRVGGVAEVPFMSGRYYKVLQVDDLGKSYPNEHRFAILQADYTVWPTPYP